MKAYQKRALSALLGIPGIPGIKGARELELGQGVFGWLSGMVIAPWPSPVGRFHARFIRKPVPTFRNSIRPSYLRSFYPKTGSHFSELVKAFFSRSFYPKTGSHFSELAIEEGPAYIFSTVAKAS